MKMHIEISDIYIKTHKNDYETLKNYIQFMYDVSAINCLQECTIMNERLNDKVANEK
jgi:hypothetical protein